MNNLLTSYSIEFNPPINNLLSFLLMAIMILLTLYSIRNLLPELGKKIKIFLTLIRIAAVMTFLFIFFQPSIVQTTYKLEKDTVVFLIDASRSMSLRTDSTTRLDLAKEAAKTLLSRDDIKGEHNIVLYLFSKNIQLINKIQDIRIINEDSTDILTSLEAVKSKHPNTSNIFLITDGIDNNILLNHREEIKSIIKRFAKNLEIPIHTILTGEERESNDISVRIISSSPIGFIGKEFKITVRLTNNSKLTDSLTLNIKENGTPIYSAKYHIPHSSTKDISITLYPKNIGNNIYEVSVPPLEDEEFTGNNSDFFSSKIKKENIRILQIAGSVSYDVRFLRHLFKKTSNIDLISFFILRTLESDVNAPDSELSLIPFPTDSVIKDNLYGFDVIIFQDFGFAPYGLNSTFAELNRFIKKGGSLIFITGNNWFKWIGDFISFFNDCMPAIPRIDDNAIENIIYKPELTIEGKTHQVTRILPSQEENNLLYKNLPELHGIHRVSQIKPTAITLMVANVNEESVPLLLLNRCEKGKTILITTDELWRFSFSEKTPDEFNLYNKLMNNLIQWAIGEPEKEDIIVYYNHQRGSSNVLKGRYHGIIGSSEVSMQLENGTTITGNIDSEGVFNFDVSNLNEGLHSAKISYQNQIFKVFFYKKKMDVEMQEITPRPDILKELSKYSGGKYIEDINSYKNLKMQKKIIKKVYSESKKYIWNKAIFLIVIVTLFSAEWFFRRMFGHQ